MSRHVKDPIQPGDGDPRHGNNGYQNYFCRCDICKKAHTDYHYDYMQRNLEQQFKNRDRSRRKRGLSEEELVRLEMEYQMGRHRGGRQR